MAGTTVSTTASCKERAHSPGPAGREGAEDTATSINPAPQYLHGIKFILAFTCICIILFLIVLVSRPTVCQKKP